MCFSHAVLWDTYIEISNKEKNDHYSQAEVGYEMCCDETVCQREKIVLALTSCWLLDKMQCQ